MAQDYAGRLRRQALLPRVLTAVIGIPLIGGLLWLGGPWWLFLAVAILALALWEFAPLRGLTVRSTTTLALVGLIAFTIIALGPEAVIGWTIGAWALVLLAFGLAPLIRTGVTPSPPARPLPGSPSSPPAAPSPSAAPSHVNSVVLGVAYLATPFAMLVRWRQEMTPLSVLAFLIVIWANDIGAYFVGLAIGRHKLAPRVSPGKSWEGAFGGLAGGLLAGLLVAPWLHLVWGNAAAWAVGITIVSQAGDLFESALKRRAGVKDSGRLLPGHGGVLDRFDGILIAAPVAYVFLRLLAGR